MRYVILTVLTLFTAAGGLLAGFMFAISIGGSAAGFEHYVVVCAPLGSCVGTLAPWLTYYLAKRSGSPRPFIVATVCSVIFGLVPVVIFLLLRG